MKKSSFAAMISGTVSGVLFALGMCMALIPEWGAFKPGLALGSGNATKDQIIAKDNEKGIGTDAVIAKAKDDRALLYCRAYCTNTQSEYQSRNLRLSS